MKKLWLVLTLFGVGLQLQSSEIKNCGGCTGNFPVAINNSNIPGQVVLRVINCLGDEFNGKYEWKDLNNPTSTLGSGSLSIDNGKCFDLSFPNANVSIFIITFSYKKNGKTYSTGAVYRVSNQSFLWVDKKKGQPNLLVKPLRLMSNLFNN